MPVASEPYTTVYHVKQKLFTRRTELSFFIPNQTGDFCLAVVSTLGYYVSG